MGAVHRRREEAGRKDSDDAVEEGRAGADRDQREHVEVAGAQRCGTALEERPAAIEHGRNRQRQLEILPGVGVKEGKEVDAEEMVGHVDDEQDQRQRRRHDQPALHVDKFGVGPFLAGRDHRLQRHAADRAVAGTVPDDLRMHRAGVERALRHRTGRRGRVVVMAVLLVGIRLQVSIRPGDELCPAAFRAEVIRDAVMHRLRLARVRIDGHPADRIGRHVACLVCMLRVIVHCRWTFPNKRIIYPHRVYEWVTNAS